MNHMPCSRTGKLALLRGRLAESTYEQGFVIAYSAIMITVLLALGGFAVDVGNWYLNAQHLQRSADSAALAGSIYLPSDPTSARSTAQDILEANVDDSNIQTIGQRDGHPTQLKVALTKTVKNYFVSMLGYESITLSRSAVAEYRPYVPMGSPSNLLGQEPSTEASWEKAQNIGLQSHYWLNVSAAGTPKSNGDRYNAGRCGNADKCDTTMPIPTGNDDYSTTGQTYVVRIANGTTGTLAIQAFDAGLAYVGDNCTATTLDNANNYSPTGTNLYRAGNNEPACTGDTMSDLNGNPEPTTYQLFTPELSEGGGSQPVTATTCQPRSFDGYKGYIRDKVNPSSSQYSATFVGWFRKWTTVCTLYIGSTTPPGDYLLRVSTSDSWSYNGQNRFALRAGMLTNGGAYDAANSQNISLFAKGRLVVYAHENTGDVTFYIARLQSGAAGRQLTVTLFDIGDADGGANLSFLPPTDGTVDGTAITSFSNCQYTPPNSSTYQNTGTNCSLTGLTSATHNGKIINISVPVPTGYTCNDTSPDGCWTRLRIQYGIGSTQDTTSWEVALNGNPVRLVIEN